MSYKLSICIVAFHNYNKILDAVKSIEKYTSESISKTTYIVDNDGKYDDAEKFKNELKKYPNVNYIDTGTNLGFGKGHNYILPKLDSEYHAIVNPDVLLIEDAFSSILKFMDENKDVGMVVPRIISEAGQIQEVYREELTVFDMFIRMFCKKLFPRRIAKHTLRNKDYSKLFRVPFAQGSFLVGRTVLLKDLKGFDDNFFMYVEDADLCRRVNLVSQLMYFPDATVIHKWEMGSHKSKNLFKFHAISMKYYFKKWGIRWK